MQTTSYAKSLSRALGLSILLAFHSHVQAAPPDLTAAGAIAALKTDPNSTPVYGETYNLGPTGLRGWIWIDRNDVGADGLQTAQSRQILVTVASTPGSAVLAVDDLILGAMAGSSGTVPAFTSDCRKTLGVAIGDAEKTGAGTLRIKRWRAGTTTDVNIPMAIIGNYTATAPYTCSKSSLILANARTKLVDQLLANEPILTNDWAGAISGLALLAGVAPADANYAAVQTRLQTYARGLAATPPDTSSLYIWDWGYIGIFLSEYYLSTSDANVVTGMNNYIVELAKVQSRYGTYGHGGSLRKADGSLHGTIPPYGPVNMAGLPANMAIVVGKKALQAASQPIDPEIDPAIQRGADFFAYYVNKGGIPYGEHEPNYNNHGSNGKDPMCAVLFGLQTGRTVETEFFTRMAVAGCTGREYGHTGQGFSYLWGAMGANMGGELAVAEYLKNVRWHLDLSRRTDGSFAYDGGEQYGAGTTAGGTYLGASSYYGLSPTACYILNYSLPLKRLYITGKNANPANTLDAAKVANAMAASTIKQDVTTFTTTQLIAALSEFDPIVRNYVARELATRTLTSTELTTLRTMVTGANANGRMGACQTLGRLQDTAALPLLSGRLSDADLWVRAQAATALRQYAPAVASAQLTPMLNAFVANATDPEVIVWNDPIQNANRYLSMALFGNGVPDGSPGNDVAAYTINAPKNLLYPAVKAGLKQPDSYPRTGVGQFTKDFFTLPDVQALLLDLVELVEVPSQADTMWNGEARGNGIATLAKYKINDGIPLALEMLDPLPGFGWSSDLFQVPGLNALASYGDAARWTLPTLRGYLGTWNTQSYQYSSLLDTIASIENAITAPAQNLGSAVANSQVVATTGAKAIALSGVSPRTSVTFLNVNAPAHGTLTGTAPNLTYTPTGGYSGPDSFTFQTSDGLTTSTPGTVSIIVGSAGTGLKGEYYNNADFTNLLLTRTDATVNFDWGTGSPNGAIGADTFSVRWSGLLLVPETGTYAFSTLNSDGVRLYINGNLLIDDYVDQTTNWKDGASINLTAGQMVELQMEYYENTGSAVAKLKWTGPSFAGANGAIIGTEWLFDGTGVSNRTPYAHAQTVTLVQNNSQAVTLSGSGGTLTYSVVTPPTNGTLTGTAPNLTYTPSVNFNGSDSFTFLVNNGNGNSTPATVSIGIWAGLPVSYTWLNPISGNWSVAGNWTSGAPAATGQAFYHLHFPSGTYTVTQNLNNGFQLNQLNVAGEVTIAGATKSLAFTANGPILPQFNQNSSSAVIIDTPVSLSAMTTFGGSSAGQVTISSLISGTGGLTKSNAGTLQINNAANTYSGGTTISSGVIALGMQANSALGTGPVTLTGGQLYMDRISAANALIVYGGNIFSENGFGNSISGPVTLHSNLTIQGPSYATMTFNGSISGAGGLILNGPPVTLQVASSYTGPTSVTASTLRCNVPTALGSGALSIGSAVGAKVNLNFTGTRNIASLSLGGAAMPGGTYGSTASPATNKNDTYFSGTGTVTVATANVAPVATPQSVSTAEDTAKPITLAATDANGNPLSYAIVTPPASGTLSGTPPNVTYTPAANFNGAASFTFKANDGTVDSAPATVSITMTAVNDVPIASAQSASTPEDTAKAITLAGTDVEGSTLAYSIVANPASGTLSGTPPNVTYTPAANYNGADSFTFKVNDGSADSANATVNLTVTAVNDAPVATAQSVTTTMNTAKVITLAGTDVENSALTYAIVASPTSGTLSGTAPNLTYTPAANFTGAASFTFKVNDGSVDSATATVSITVTSSAFIWNSAVSGNWSDGTKWTTGSPASAGLATYVFHFNASGTYTATHNLNAGFLLNQLNFGGSTVTLAGNSLAFVANGGTLPSINQNSTNAVTITTPVNLGSALTFGGTGNGEVTVSSLISGAGSLTKNGTGTLKITNANNSYSGGTIINSGTLLVDVLANAGLGTGPVTLNGGTLYLERISNTNALIVNGGNLHPENGFGDVWGGSVTLNADLVIQGPSYATMTFNGSISGTGGLTLNGQGPVVLQVANSYTGPTSVTASILHCNVPTALGSGALSISSTANSKVNLNFTGTRNIDSLSLGGATMPGGTYGSTASPATNKNDTYFSGTGTVTVPGGINNAPVANAQSVSTAEDIAKAITLTATDADGNPLTYTIVSPPASGTLSGTAPNVTYTPAANFNGAASFTFKVNDGTVDSVTVTVSITVTAVNDPPIASAQSVSTAEDTAKAITLTATDADGNPLTYTIVSSPASGTLNGTAPNVTYTPAANYNGAASFTFKVNDGTVDSATVTVSITVTAVNDVPVFTTNPIIAAGAVEGLAYTGQTLAGQAADADAGATITYSKVSGPAWLAVASNGALSGTPTAGTAGLNSFVVRATDNASATADATLQITVTGLPLPWVAGDIGTGMLAGTTTHNAGTFTQAGSGIIGSTADKLRFTYQTLSGDGEIIAKISALQNTGTSARVGVMIRDTLATNSKQIFIGMNGSSAYRWMRRTTTGGTTTSSNSSNGTVPNTWIRLVRSGTTITAYKSTNGTSWTTVGSTTNTTFSSTCYIGLAVGSGSDTTLNTSQFSNVSVTP